MTKVDRLQKDLKEASKRLSLAAMSYTYAKEAYESAVREARKDKKADEVRTQ